MTSSAADGGEGDYVGTDYYSHFEGALEPGDYILKVEIGAASASQPITIAGGEIATPHFVLNAAVLKLHPLPSEGAEIDDDASTEIRLNGEYLAYDYGDVDIVVPAGALEAIVTIGEATVSRTYEPKAGETVDEDVVLGTGVVFLTTEYAPGAKVEADIFMEIFEAKAALDGARKSVAYGYGGEQDFELPSGDYVMDYKLGGTSGQVPFSVETAERTDVPVTLDAGVLAVTTPSDEYVEIFSAGKDIAGNRQSFDYGYGPDFQTTLKAGDYTVLSKKGDVSTETPVTIKAGERFELTVEAAAAAGGKKK